MFKLAGGIGDMLGDPGRAVRVMAVPLFFAFLVSALQTFIDGAWCSGLGADPLSAIGISAPVYRIVVALGLGMGVGVSASLARSIGAGDMGRASRLNRQAVVLSLALSVPVSVVSYVVAEPLVVISGGGNNVDLCMDYVTPFVLCSFPLILSGMLQGMLRGEGDAKRAMALSVVASLANIILDPLMIYGLGMGVAGASMATCIATAVSSAIGLCWFYGGRTEVPVARGGPLFDRGLARDIFSVGAPHSVSLVVVPLFIVPEQAMVVSCGGTDGLVVYIAGFTIVSLAMIPSQAIASATVPVVSAALGQRDIRKAYGAVSHSMRAAVIIGAALGLVFLLFPGYAVSAYTYGEDMSRLAGEMAKAVMIYSAVPAFKGVLDVAMAAIQACRRAVLATANAIFREVLFLAFFAAAAGMSMDAIYWSVDAVNVICAMTAVALMAASLRGAKRSILAPPSDAGPARNQ